MRATARCDSAQSPERLLRHYEFPLLDSDTLSCDLCRHAPARLGCVIKVGDCGSAMRRWSWCFRWPATVVAGSLRSVNPPEHENRYLPSGLLLILGKNRYLCGLAVEQPLALRARRNRGPDPKALASQFDRRLGVGN
jgi:hypothetical protein